MSDYTNPLLEGASDEFRLRVRIEQLEAALAAKGAEMEMVLDELDALRDHILAEIPYRYEDGTDEDADPGECVWYAGQELKRLRAAATPPPDAADAGEVPHA